MGKTNPGYWRRLERRRKEREEIFLKIPGPPLVYTAQVEKKPELVIGEFAIPKRPQFQQSFSGAMKELEKLKICCHQAEKAYEKPESKMLASRWKEFRGEIEYLQNRIKFFVLITENSRE